MKSLVLILMLFINLLIQYVPSHATTFSLPSRTIDGKKNGSIIEINVVKKNININGISYKLSNTVKVYGFNGNKYINVKKLKPQMFVNFKSSTQKGNETISEIWVRPN